MIEEICDKAGVTLAYFDNDLWPRPGMILSDMKIIFVNKSLSGDAQKRVIFARAGPFRAHDGRIYHKPDQV